MRFFSEDGPDPEIAALFHERSDTENDQQPISARAEVNHGGFRQVGPPLTGWISQNALRTEDGHTVTVTLMDEGLGSSETKDIRMSVVSADGVTDLKLTYAEANDLRSVLHRAISW